MSFPDVSRVAKTWMVLTCACPGGLERSAALPCGPGCPAALACPWPPSGLSGAALAFLCFLWVISVLKMALKCSAKVLASVPKVEEAVMCVL